MSSLSGAPLETERDRVLSSMEDLPFTRSKVGGDDENDAVRPTQLAVVFSPVLGGNGLVA